MGMTETDYTIIFARSELVTISPPSFISPLNLKTRFSFVLMIIGTLKQSNGPVLPDRLVHTLMQHRPEQQHQTNPAMQADKHYSYASSARRSKENGGR